MKLPVSWLRDYVDIAAEPAAIATRLAACGFAAESVDGDVIDFEVTANRPDCLNIYGLAREAATAFDVALKPAPGEAAPTSASSAAPIKVSLGDGGCGRYAVAVLDVTVAPSPEWMTARLLAAGVRPISNVVDITNYVMIELGHPMHAFDAARLAGNEIRVRRARAGESLTTLDGESRKLDETMLVIADRERAVALAGVMGGLATEVSAGTARVVLESAWFQPATVRATSKKLGLKTEASARFERGADQAAPVRALRRALALFAEIGAGRLVGGITDVYPRAADSKYVSLRRARVARLLGETVPDEAITRILGRLGFRLSPAPDGWVIGVPTFRVDVAREADLIEEVGRHWGLDHVPATFPSLRTTPPPSDPGIFRGRHVRRLLCGAGLQEAVTFTFMEAEWAAAYSAPDELVHIANPLSEKFAVLRPSIVPGLVDALAWSRRRESADVRLFEVGAVFSRRAERTAIGWVMTGSRGDHWSGGAGTIGFSDTKGVAELLASAAGVTISVQTADDLSWLRNGQRARLVLADGTLVGWVGQLAAVRGLSDADVVFGGEIDLAALSGIAASVPRPIDPLPRFPSIVRDLSIVVDERLPAADVRGTIRANAPATLVAVREFDRYQGKGVPAGSVSLSVRLTFRDAERTLTDADVQRAVETIVTALSREHGASLRGAGERPPVE